MPIIRKQSKLSRKNPLKRSFVERIQTGKVAPVLSNEAICDLVLGGQEAVCAGYAEYIEYPLPNGNDLRQMAKFNSITHELDDWELKSDYLNFIKNHLYVLAAQAASLSASTAGPTRTTSPASTNRWSTTYTGWTAGPIGWC